MLTIHHLANSQSERVVWLCEELALDYQLVRYEREPSMAAPAEFKALHPAGTAPTITDGETTLAETGAVFEYILAGYGDGRLVVDKDDPDFADYLFWYHFANGSMAPSLVVGIVMRSLQIQQSNGLSAGVLARADTGYAMFEERLAQVPFLAGDRFTAADVLNLFALTTLSTFAGRDLSSFPAIGSYVARMTERPAYRRARSRAEPSGQ